MKKGMRLAAERRKEYEEMMRNKLIAFLQAHARQLQVKKQLAYTK